MPFREIARVLRALLVKETSSAIQDLESNSVGQRPCCDVPDDSERVHVHVSSLSHTRLHLLAQATPEEARQTIARAWRFNGEQRIARKDQMQYMENQTTPTQS